MNSVRTESNLAPDCRAVACDLPDPPKIGIRYGGTLYEPIDQLLITCVAEFDDDVVHTFGEAGMAYQRQSQRVRLLIPVRIPEGDNPMGAKRVQQRIDRVQSHHGLL